MSATPDRMARPLCRQEEMTDTPQADKAHLTGRELAFLGISVLLWAGYVVFLGKDTSWDFRNYHWYIPYALLNGRMHIDLLVAHQGSYYNPYIDVPFYLLAEHMPSWFAVGMLGVFQGANIIPIYLLSRATLHVPQNRLISAGLSFFCMTGGLTLSLYGTHYYDNVLSVFIMSALCILALKRETLATGRFCSVFLWCALGGFLCGASAGLKLPTAPFAMGYGAALLFIGGSGKHIFWRVLGGVLGGLIGFLLCDVPWMYQMYIQTGNPLFPYFNQIFHSPLALNSAYRDMRFLPTSNLKALLYPILFALDYRVADDLPHTDIRIAIAYVFIIVSVLIWLVGRRSKTPLAVPAGVRVIFAFVAVSYFFWIRVFAIHRYILTLEMLAPLLFCLAIALLPLKMRTRLILMAALCFFALLCTRSAVMQRAPLGDPYIKTDMPAFQDPDHTMVLLTGDAPLGFITPTLPAQIPVLRIDGWMVQPDDGTVLTRDMRARVRAHKGPLVLIADAYDMQRANTAISAYGLAMDYKGCHIFHTNLYGVYQWCPLTRQVKP